MIRILDMGFYPWHVVAVVSMGYILWQVVGMYYPRSEAHRAESLSYINFGLAFSFAVLCFACVLHIFYSTSTPMPESLLQLSMIIWTITVCVIAFRSSLPRPIAWLSCLMVSGAPLLHYLFHRGPSNGLSGFLDKLDEFTRFAGGKGGEGLKLSLFLKWLFFFTSSFLVLNYYGGIYQISHTEKIERGDKKPGLQKEAIDRAIVVLSIAFSVFVALALIGTDIKSLSLFSGLVAAGVSIALRDLMANMAAGLLLLWDKSIKTDDVISLDETRYGEVKSMTLRYLVLEDRNDIRFLIPNSDIINKTITNWTQESRKVRLKLDIGVAYDSDMVKVKDIIGSVCLRVDRVLQDPPPRVLILGFGESAIHLQLRFFIKDPENGIRNVASELYELLLGRFKDAKIKIPAPQRDIRLLSEDGTDLSPLVPRGRDKPIKRRIGWRPKKSSL